MDGYQNFRDFDATTDLTFDAELTKIWGVDYWRIDIPFVFYIGGRVTDRYVLAERGTATDGVSIKRPFRWFIDPWGKYGNAVIIHDILCRWKTIYINGNQYPVKNKEIDLIFLEAMKVSGVGLLRYLLYAGVRFADMFGMRK
jgi:hypothetical protein